LPCRSTGGINRDVNRGKKKIRTGGAPFFSIAAETRRRFSAKRDEKKSIRSTDFLSALLHSEKRLLL